MEIKFVYKCLPAFIFYVKDISIIGKWMKEKKYLGYTVYNLVFIRKSQVNNKCLLQHELTHVKQVYRTLMVIHGWLYRFSKKYRLKAEAEAYAQQALCKANGLYPKLKKYVRAYARLLSSGLYDLGCDYDFEICCKKILDYMEE